MYKKNLVFGGIGSLTVGIGLQFLSALYRVDVISLIQSVAANGQLLPTNYFAAGVALTSAIVILLGLAALVIAVNYDAVAAE